MERSWKQYRLVNFVTGTATALQQKREAKQDAKALAKELDVALLGNSIHRLTKTSKIKQLNRYNQHGATSRMEHSMAVAYYSLAIARFLHLKCDRASLVNGALLHDYFLYDWHEVQLSALHGFHHPRIAAETAKEHVSLNEREEDIIRKHMFPMTIVPPKHRESFLVCMADKYCAMAELLEKHPYKEIFAPFEDTDFFEKI